MIKIVLYLGYKAADSKYNYYRQVERVGIYLDTTEGNFVELTKSVDGWVKKVVLSESQNTKYIYVQTATEDDYNTVINSDSRWELVDNPV